MSRLHSHSDTWVVFEIRQRAFTVPVRYVREILVMPDVTAVPLASDKNRGVINLRGQVMPLVDVRKHFGWQSVPEEVAEFSRLMGQREQDHHHWLSELERATAENTEFRLATDPHECAFGRWYYSYRSDSPWIMGLLRKFEVPHSRIHGLAATVCGLAQDGKAVEARILMEQVRNAELREMASLFQQLKDLVRDTARELAMVLLVDGKTFAISIDAAVAVENIPAEAIRTLTEAEIACTREQMRRVAQRKAADSLAIVLEPERIAPWGAVN